MVIGFGRNLALQASELVHDYHFDLRTMLIFKSGDSQTRPVGGQLIKDLEELGQITVEAYRIKGAWPTAYKHSQARDFKPGEVPEKALKGRALSHHST